MSEFNHFSHSKKKSWSVNFLLTHRQSADIDIIPIPNEQSYDSSKRTKTFVLCGGSNKNRFKSFLTGRKNYFLLL